MYSHPVLLDSHLHDHIAELWREIDNDRLADLASANRRGRSIRRHIADWLVSAAEWVDGESRYAQSQTTTLASS
jgi:hypothetical protein